MVWKRGYIKIYAQEIFKDRVEQELPRSYFARGKHIDCFAEGILADNCTQRTLLEYLVQVIITQCWKRV
jgi:hypothetical protein